MLLLSKIRAPRLSSTQSHMRSALAPLSGMIDPTKLQGLKAIERKSIWLASFMIHNANTLREKKVLCNTITYVYKTLIVIISRMV